MNRRHAWQGALLLVSFLGCASEREVTLQVDDEQGPIAGIEVQLVGGAKLGTTGPTGQKTITVKAKKDEVIRVSLHDPRERYLFDPAYELNRGFESGVLRVRAKSAEGGADATSLLRIESDPSGAEALVDGTSSGLTPCLVEGLRSGDTPTIILRLAGFRADTVQLYLDAGEILHRRTLVRRSNVPDPQPMVDTTPIVDPKPRADPKPKADPKTDGDDRAPDRDPPSAAFEKSYTISTTPSVAEVYVDDDPRNRNGAGAFKITLAGGKHRFHVVHRPTGTDFWLDYTVRKDDGNRKLVLQLDEKRIEARAQ